MSQLNALLTDLRDRKLWPLPILLVAALVAVPLLLSKSPAPSSQAPSVALPVAQAHTGPTVSVDANSSQAQLSGHGRDPFVQQKLPGAKTTSTTTSTTPSGGTSPTGSSNNGSSTTVSGGSTGTNVVSPVLPVNPSQPGHSSSPPASTPQGLTADEAYHVSLSITTPAGGLDTVDPLKRDSELPSSSQPRLIEVGVMQDGKHVLFAVQPGAVVGGPGTCTPGPVDCEVLSLAPGQTESVTQAGSTQPATLFQVTEISVDHYATAAQASKARAVVDAAGRRTLAGSTSSTLALFQYDPALDAVVDQRNLTVGGN